MHEQAPDPDGPARRAAIERAVDERVPIVNGPHVWIGTIASYEAARPHGRWLTLNQPLGELQAAVDEVVAADDDEPAPGDQRWGVFSALGFGRYPPAVITTLPELVGLARLAREEVRAFHAWCRLGGDDREWSAQFYDHYLGCYDAFADWLNLQVEVAGWDSLIDRVLPAELRPHVEINLASLGHDLLTSGEVYTVPDQLSRGVFVFRGRSP